MKLFQSLEKRAAVAQFCQHLYCDRLTRSCPTEGSTLCRTQDGPWKTSIGRCADSASAIRPPTAIQSGPSTQTLAVVPSPMPGLYGKTRTSRLPKRRCKIHGFDQSDLETRDGVVGIHATRAVAQKSDIQASSPPSLDVGGGDQAVESGIYHLS